MLDEKNTCLIIVDVQDKLANLMHNKQQLFDNLTILANAAKILNLPILWCEQNPTRLGPTIEPLREILNDQSPIAKMSFSCTGSEDFTRKLNALNRNHAIICGIESHICVYQTAAHLLKKGYDVTIPADAVSSRTEQNLKIALRRLRTLSANISSVEMTLFELLQSASHPAFKQIASLVK